MSEAPRQDRGRAAQGSVGPTPADSEFASRYFRRGLGLRREIRGAVQGDYDSDLVRGFRENGYVRRAAGITFRLAREFGFCYGVERAVDYAYETATRFKDRRIVLTGEIIHNPEVNDHLRMMGIRFLGESGCPDISALGPQDVIVIPAFGVPAERFAMLRDTGAVVVDTTCGSVLNVWKNVERYAREGRTSVVHGKANHEETRATVSRVLLTEGAHYVVVLDLEEAGLVADAIRGESRGGWWTGATFRERFAGRTSAGFDPDRHLERVGMANQTTMLSGESIAIARIIEDAFVDRYGAEETTTRFRAFDTICSATQERQDALEALIREPLDLVFVIGGYNSSNTGHLLEIASEHIRAFHMKGPECLVSREVIRHKPVGGKREIETVIEGGWLPDGEVRIGLTAGASTPDTAIGAVVERILELRQGPSDAEGVGEA